MTGSPILVYPDPDRQYYLLTDSSKHSWDGILIQYEEQANKDGTIVNVPHPIIYQSGTFQGSQKHSGVFTKETYAIYMSFCKMAFYLRDSDVIMPP